MSCLLLAFDRTRHGNCERTLSILGHSPSIWTGSSCQKRNLKAHLNRSGAGDHGVVSASMPDHKRSPWRQFFETCTSPRPYGDMCRIFTIRRKAEGPFESLNSAILMCYSDNKDYSSSLRRSAEYSLFSPSPIDPFFSDDKSGHAGGCAGSETYGPCFGRTCRMPSV